MTHDTLVIYVWAAIACGIIAAMIAGSKERSRLWYFWAGFLFGIFGILAAILRPADRPTDPGDVTWRPGWYEDPRDPRQEWYWDGRDWSSEPRPRTFA